MNDTYFAPELFMPAGTRDISFYEKALGAVIVRKFMNDDGTIHVAELSINGALFHIHEATPRISAREPAALNGTTVNIGLFVSDVHVFMKKAVDAGAEQTMAAQDFDYGYRQARLKDVFGHMWTIQQKI